MGLKELGIQSMQMKRRINDIADKRTELIDEEVDLRLEQEQLTEAWMGVVEDIVELDGGDSHRVCSECGKIMHSGYCIRGGEEYFCSDECLYINYTQKERDELYGDGETDSYWTERE